MRWSRGARSSSELASSRDCHVGVPLSCLLSYTGVFPSPKSAKARFELALERSWAVVPGIALDSPCLAMNVIQEIKRINERELQQGVSGKASWHHEYKDSAWVFAGGFPYDLTEGDLLCVMSQWGEIEDINLCREKGTGKSKVTLIMGVLV